MDEEILFFPWLGPEALVKLCYFLGRRQKLCESVIISGTWGLMGKIKKKGIFILQKWNFGNSCRRGSGREYTAPGHPFLPQTTQRRRHAPSIVPLNFLSVPIGDISGAVLSTNGVFGTG